MSHSIEVKKNTKTDIRKTTKSEAMKDISIETARRVTITSSINGAITKITTKIRENINIKVTKVKNNTSQIIDITKAQTKQILVNPSVMEGRGRVRTHTKRKRVARAILAAKKIKCEAHTSITIGRHETNNRESIITTNAIKTIANRIRDHTQRIMKASYNSKDDQTTYKTGREQMGGNNNQNTQPTRKTHHRSP